MRILLIGNYAPDKQESMLRFAELMERELTARGHAVTLLQPRPIVGRWASSHVIGKWLGYIDKFVLFPFLLQRTQVNFDVVHLCDHSNSMYVKYFSSTPSVVTCHDVLAIASALGEVAENRVGPTGRILQRMILEGLKVAQFVVCVSTLTNSEMLRVTGRSPETSVVVYSSLNYPYSPMPKDEAIHRLQLLGCDPNAPFFMHVGGASWYKNRPALLAIWSHLQPSLMLIIGNKIEGNLKNYIMELGLEKSIVCLSGLSNEDLRAVYSLAEALIFPSIKEGFGWPVLEAQACGCPVFTTNREPMTEIGGDGAVYLDPSQPREAATIISSSLGQRGAMVRLGLQNLNRFTVEQMIDGYVSAYEHVRSSAAKKTLS